MALPTLDHQGRLPTGRHSADWGEVEKRFVDEAPFGHDLRNRVWGGFALWTRQVHLHFGPATVWLGGRFVTHDKGDPTLKVMVHPETPSMVNRAIERGNDGMSLLTLVNVVSYIPDLSATDKIHPVAGMLETVLASTTADALAEAMWALNVPAGRFTTTVAGFVSMEV